MIKSRIENSSDGNWSIWRYLSQEDSQPCNQAIMIPSSLSTIQPHIQCILYTHTHTVKITMHIIRTIVVLTLILPQCQTQTLHYLFPKITSYQKVLVPLAKSSSFRTRLLLLTANREHEASKSLGISFNIDLVDSNDNLLLI